jgi:hypothetical protein
MHELTGSDSPLHPRQAGLEETMREILKLQRSGTAVDEQLFVDVFTPSVIGSKELLKTLPVTFATLTVLRYLGSSDSCVKRSFVVGKIVA